MMLKTDNRRSRSILTLGGTITYSRYYLRPTDDNSREILRREYHAESVCPTDEFLGTDNLPFRMTCSAALRIAKIALECSSYEQAEYHVSNEFGEHVSDDRIRQVVLYIGGIICKDVSMSTETSAARFNQTNIKLGKKRGRPSKEAFVLCMEVSEPAKNIYICRSYALSHPEHVKSPVHVDYYMGNFDGFRNVVIREALDNGLEKARELVIVVDKEETAHFCREIFPYAKIIIGLNYLYDRILLLGEQLARNRQNSAYRAKYFSRQAIKHIEAGKWESIFEMNEVQKKKDNNAACAAVDDFKAYLERNSEYLQYQSFKQNHYPIDKTHQAGPQTEFEKNKINKARWVWSLDTIPTYFALYSKLLSREWYSYVVPLIREKYRQKTVDNSVGSV